MKRKTGQVLRLQDLTEYELGFIDAVFYSLGIFNRMPTMEEFDLAMERLDDFIQRQGSPGPLGECLAPEPMAVAVWEPQAM